MILIYLVFLLAVLFGLVFYSRSEKLNIQNVEISGNKTIENKIIEETAKNIMAGYYFGFVPKTNFLFYPKKEIRNDLAYKFKILKDISFNLKNLQTLEITLAEREAKYTWCGNYLISPEDKLPDENPLSESAKLQDGECYFMDEKGYIFDKAPYFSGEVYFRFYGAINTGEAGPLGSYFFQSNFDKLISLKEALEKIGINPVIYYFKDNGEARIFLSPFSARQIGPEIIFKIDSDPDKIAENLQAVLATEPLQSDFKNKYSSLLYIDLRLGNKVYYKFR